MAGPPRGPRPQARGPFGAPRWPKHLDKIRHSLTPPALDWAPRSLKGASLNRVWHPSQSQCPAGHSCLRRPPKG
eukprot:6876429-Alexandrium_andersonii.AAC.1